MGLIKFTAINEAPPRYLSHGNNAPGHNSPPNQTQRTAHPLPHTSTNTSALIILHKVLPYTIIPFVPSNINSTGPFNMSIKYGAFPIKINYTLRILLEARPHNCTSSSTPSHNKPHPRQNSTPALPTNQVYLLNQQTSSLITKRVAGTLITTSVLSDRAH